MLSYVRLLAADSPCESFARLAARCASKSCLRCTCRFLSFPPLAICQHCKLWYIATGSAAGGSKQLKCSGSGHCPRPSTRCCVASQYTPGVHPSLRNPTISKGNLSHGQFDGVASHYTKKIKKRGPQCILYCIIHCQVGGRST